MNIFVLPFLGVKDVFISLSLSLSLFTQFEWQYPAGARDNRMCPCFPVLTENSYIKATIGAIDTKLLKTTKKEVVLPSMLDPSCEI